MEVEGGRNCLLTLQKKEEKVNEITKTTGSNTNNMGRRRIH